MYKIKLSILAIFFPILLYLLHTYAMMNHLYLNVSFFDLITHFIGGVCIALLTFYIFKNTKYIIPAIIIVGIAWEIFEVYFGIAGWPVSSILYKIDTTKDFFVDILGALVAIMIIRKKK